MMSLRYFSSLLNTLKLVNSDCALILSRKCPHSSLIAVKYAASSARQSHCINVLKCSLGITENRAKEIVGECKELYLKKPENLLSKIKHLQKSGISLQSIGDSPRLLLLSKEKITHCTDLACEINVEPAAFPKIMTLSYSLIRKIYLSCKRDLREYEHHRIEFLSKNLLMSHEEIFSIVPKYLFLMNMSYKNMREIMAILLENGVQPQDIRSDPWVLRCKADFVKTRLETLQTSDVDCMKPWMVRCSESILNTFLKRFSTTEKILGELSLEEYLSKRLECSVDEIKAIIDREEQLQKTSVLKMKKILDFLSQSGFTTSQIIAGLPRVANRRIETIHLRLLELNQAGISPSLYILGKSKREYQCYVNKKKIREN